MKVTTGQKLLGLGILMVIIDQVSKILVKTHMFLGQHFDVLGDWFKIAFVENKGMAFGMSFGGIIGKYALSSFRVILSILLIWWIAQLLKKRASEKQSGLAVTVPMGVLVGLTLITAGAIGNIIDCLFYGQIFTESTYDTVASFGGSYAPFLQGRVVDMLYFPLIDTYLPDWMPLVGGKHFTFFDPVFNYADSCVTVGTIYLVLFQYKFFMKEENWESKA